MDKTMADWFFMRRDFKKLKLEPEENRKFLFGKTDNEVRDTLLDEIEGASYATDGYKAVLFGDYGRGKTHVCLHLMHEITRKKLPVVPSYIKCPEFAAKEPFESLFRGFVLSHLSEELNRIATEYARKEKKGEAAPLYEIVKSEDIAHVMSKGLAAVDPDAVKKCARWLGGETKLDMEMVGKSLQPHLIDSRDFGAVLKGLTHMFATVDQKVPVYFIDEAERLQQVNHPDTYFRWLAAMREITEISGVGMVFFIGANSKNDIPVLLMQPEIQRRILVSNYLELYPQGKDEIRSFVDELLATVIRKGTPPQRQMNNLSPEALDATVPQELRDITGNDAERLAAYPFEPEALEEFLTNLAEGAGSNKPSEILGRMQRAGLRVMRQGKRTIDLAAVNAVQQGGV
jgi:hypothetical protein